MRVLLSVLLLVAVASATKVVDVGECDAFGAQGITNAVEYRGSSPPFHTEVLVTLANGKFLRDHA